MINLNFSEKSLGPVFPPHSTYDVSRKIFLRLYYIDWPNFIVWLTLFFKILGNVCVTIVS